MKLVVKICLISTIMFSSAIADENINPDTINQVQEEAAEFISSSEMTREAIEAFAQQAGIEFGVENKKGQIFFQATSSVSVNPTNAQWAKWRVVAYKKAFSSIKQNFLADIYGKITTETLTEYVNDDSDNRLEFPKDNDPRRKSKSAVIWDKLHALSGAKLDAALEDLGIDPSQYNALPLEKRKNLFRDKFTEKSIKRAAGSLAGLMTIKTFEGTDTKGNHSIGVIAMYMPKLKQLAYDISHNREPMLSKKSGKSIDEYLPKSKKALSQTFGVRLAFNEDGAPILISYGQWSYMYKGKSQKKRDRGYEFALKKAKTESQKQIAQFLDARAQFKEMEETSAVEDENAVLNYSDDMVTVEEVTQMVDKMSSSLKVKSKVDLKGVKVKKKTSYKHPTGHEIVMVVSVWSQENASHTDSIRNFKPSSRTTTSKVNHVSEESSVDEGVGMDLDF